MRIGIVADYRFTEENYPYARYLLRENYLDLLGEEVLPIIIPHIHSKMDEYISLIDGVIIPGCDHDIHPKFYGEEILSEKVSTIMEMDKKVEFELLFTKKVMEKNMPFFGICNGMQILNVACKGTLIQDIPTFKPSDINHEQGHPKHVPSHDLIIDKQSKLYQIAALQANWRVNSTHHQSIGKVGEGLMVSAIAPDNIIEAIESPAHDFVIGVEWHPELIKTELDKRLYEAFLLAARTYHANKNS